EELTLHHRNGPEALAVEERARLVLAAKVAQEAADRDTLLALRQAVETRGGRAGQHALPDPIHEALAEAGRVEREQQDADAGPSVRRIVVRKLRLDARFDLAADHRGGEAGHRLRRRARPGGRMRRDDDARRTHVERLGKGVGDARSQGFGTFGALMRPSQRLLLFSSQEYSIISQSGLKVKVRVLVIGFE